MNRKIVITGATGFIGKKLFQKFLKEGDRISILTTSIEKSKTVLLGADAYISWDSSPEDIKNKLEGVEIFIHLAGENIMAKRWTKKHKIRLRKSRVERTKELIEIISKLDHKPNVFVSSSAVGIYGNSEAEVDESSHVGTDYLATLVRDWEAEVKKVEMLDIRRVNIRIGIVLDKKEGALAKMIFPFKYFVGGPLGTGQQWMPWIHIDDLTEIFVFAAANNNVSGIINGVSPNPVRMEEFSRLLGKVLNRPAFFRVPSLILKILLGEAAIVVLEGARVVPAKTVGLGYKFKYDKLENALENILLQNY